MSFQLLSRLNGQRNGLFSRYLSSLHGHTPRICWYPSAGEDLRDVLIFSEQYQRYAPTDGEPAAPELFLHTDHFFNRRTSFLDTPNLHTDGRTSIWIEDYELLPSLDLPLNERLVANPNPHPATNHVVFLKARVRSDKLGTYTVPILYTIVENTAFYALIARPCGARFSHIYQNRFGSAFGGGYSTGAWLRLSLLYMGVEAYLTDDPDQAVERDPAPSVFPELREQFAEPKLEVVRTIAKETLHGYRDSTVFRVVDP